MQSAISFPVWHSVVCDAIFLLFPQNEEVESRLLTNKHKKEASIESTSILQSTSGSVDLYRHVQDKKGSYGHKKV